MKDTVSGDGFRRLEVITGGRPPPALDLDGGARHWALVASLVATQG
jgi:hypothetical protein